MLSFRHIIFLHQSHHQWNLITIIPTPLPPWHTHSVHYSLDLMFSLSLSLYFGCIVIPTLPHHLWPHEFLSSFSPSCPDLFYHPLLPFGMHLYSSWSWVLPSKSSRVRGSQTELVLALGIAAGQSPGWFSNKLEDRKGAPAFHVLFIFAFYFLSPFYFLISIDVIICY